MTHIADQTPEKEVALKQRKSTLKSKSHVRSSFFKYYIHDGVESFRLQLLGELSEAEVPELNGCWCTARTTLSTRKLLLDLEEVTKVDDAGKLWIISMVNEGAVLSPEAFCRNGFACQPSVTGASRVSLIARLITLCRGAQSFTQAP